MNIFDENVPVDQRATLKTKGIPIRQIGVDVGRLGMTDDEIIPLLHQLDRPTFFTLDKDFCNFRLCHEAYCLVHLDVEDEMAAEYVRRILRHPELHTKSKRMGAVIRVLATELVVWRKNQRQETRHSWT
jgi:hypothetical protein